LKIKENHTFSLEPGVLETQDIILETHSLFRVDARISPKPHFEPIFLVWSNLFTILRDSKSNKVNWT
jgi:hypothetical protein